MPRALLGGNPYPWPSCAGNFCERLRRAFAGSSASARCFARLQASLSTCACSGSGAAASAQRVLERDDDDLVRPDCSVEEGPRDRKRAGVSAGRSCARACPGARAEGADSAGRRRRRSGRLRRMTMTSSVPIVGLRKDGGALAGGSSAARGGAHHLHEIASMSIAACWLSIAACWSAMDLICAASCRSVGSMHCEACSVCRCCCGHDAAATSGSAGWKRAGRRRGRTRC